MLAVIGTIPDEEFPLVAGEVSLEDGHICMERHRVPINRGTSALIGAALKTGEALGGNGVFGYLVGDIGTGKGSRRLYEFLAEKLPETGFHSIAFHYLQPIVRWHGRIMSAITSMKKRPTLVADAGAMYMAKMSGQASFYDLFTPDVGELAFLADEKAPHPFYTRGFILQEENRVPDLISRAYEHGNAARYLLVKGKRDYLADTQGVLATVEKPVVEELEAVGGTGDTLTGIISALLSYGFDIKMAAVVAARVNRLSGLHSHPTPASGIMDLIAAVPRSIDIALSTKEQ